MPHPTLSQRLLEADPCTVSQVQFALLVSKIIPSVGHLNPISVKLRPYLSATGLSNSKALKYPFRYIFAAAISGESPFTWNMANGINATSKKFARQWRLWDTILCKYYNTSLTDLPADCKQRIAGWQQFCLAVPSDGIIDSLIYCWLDNKPDRSVPFVDQTT